MVQHRVWQFILAAAVVQAPIYAAWGADPPGWNLQFVENTRLAKGFRQFEAVRPDNSRLVAFLADKGDSLSHKLPLMVFIDGSGAHSQFFEKDGKRGCGVYGALAMRAADRYHVATAEKRGVTFGDMGSVGSAEHASAEYAHHATFEDRVNEIRLLLDALLKQEAVDSSRVVLVGHSEGAPVAAGVAAADPRVTHVAFLSGNGPTQLFDLIVLRRKGMARDGADPDQIEAAVRQLERDYRKIFSDPESETKLFMGHAYKRWSSFCSHPPVESLLKTRAKLFLAHGTEDTSVPIESFDLLTAEMIRARRENVKIRRYPGRGHSLSPPDAEANGPPLVGVFDEILAWAAGENSTKSKAK